MIIVFAAPEQGTRMAPGNGRHRSFNLHDTSRQLIFSTSQKGLFDHMTNRKGAILLLVLLAPVTIYVLAASWTFTAMRDGFLIGSFPLAYLVLCLFFAFVTFIDSRAMQPLDEFQELSVVGLIRILTFIAAAVILTFWHETFGFILLCTLFVALVSWFAGQRSVLSISIYSIAVAVALFTAFTFLGFDLTIIPWFLAGN